MLILATNGGAHPPEKWAEATATVLVPVDGIEDFTRRQLALQLRAKVALALLPHHDAVQSSERDHLGSKGHAHLSTHTRHADERADEVVKAVIEAAQGTPWEKDFSYPVPLSDAQLSEQKRRENVGADALPEFVEYERLKQRMDMIKAEAASHFRTSMREEREWHCHRNPDCEHSQAWLEKSRAGHPGAVAE